MKYTCSASHLKTIADVLKDILTECWLVFESNKISMTNVDPEKVIAVNLEIVPSSDYECESRFVFPFYIQTLYKVLRGAKPHDTAILSNGPADVIQISILSGSKILKNQIVLQPLQNVLPVTYVKQKKTNAIEIHINTNQLYHILHDLSALSRKMTIIGNGGNLEFTAKDDCGSISVFSQAVSTDINFRGTYLIKYLEKFTKPALESEVVVGLSPGEPLSVLYTMENGCLELSIAPSE